jgi:glutamate dehydrogenase (NAD(P)+)
MNPDVGTDEKIMNVVKETYKTLVSNNDVNIDSVVTGKSLNFGGIGVSKQAAGYGLCRTASFVLENLDNKILKTTGLGTGGSKKSVIIQGFGQIGYNMARFLVKNDFKVVGMTDENVGCFNPMGFDPDEVYAYKKKNDGLQGISKSLNKPEDVLSQKCDIFVSSDREMNFTKNMAEKVRCKLFIEACNAPATKDALDILNKRGIVVIPDVISYSGGFIVSYLEWLKNLEHRNLTLLFKRFESNSRKVLLKLLATSEFGGAVQDNFTGPTEDELVLMTIDEIMDNSFRDVLAVAEEFNIDLKTAAFKLAIERIYNQYKNLGGFHL